MIQQSIDDTTALATGRSRFPTEEELSALDEVIAYVVDTLQHEDDAVVQQNLDLVISLQAKLRRRS